MFAGASLDENSGAFCELKANFFRLILTKAELLGLTWDDMDISEEAIADNKAYVIINKQVEREYQRMQ